MSLDFSESIMSMNGSLVHDLNRRDENGEVILSYRDLTVFLLISTMCISGKRKRYDGINATLAKTLNTHPDSIKQSIRTLVKRGHLERRRGDDGRRYLQIKQDAIEDVIDDYSQENDVSLVISEGKIIKNTDEPVEKPVDKSVENSRGGTYHHGQEISAELRPELCRYHGGGDVSSPRGGGRIIPPFNRSTLKRSNTFITNSACARERDIDHTKVTLDEIQREEVLLTYRRELPDVDLQLAIVRAEELLEAWLVKRDSNTGRLNAESVSERHHCKIIKGWVLREVRKEFEAKKGNSEARRSTRRGRRSIDDELAALRDSPFFAE